MQRLLIVLATVAALLGSVPPAADAGMVYATGDLSINRWHVHLSRHTFQAAETDGYLEIQKDTRVSEIHAGVVLINHRLISLRRFLKGSDPLLRQSVRLKQRNRLRVLLIGTPGASIRIVVGGHAHQPPIVKAFSATPASIPAGSAGTLTWSCLHADACTIEPAIGPVDPTGSITVSPTADTTYTLTATGPGGSASASATVTVVHPPPRVEISVAPDTIGPDQVSILSWHAAHSDACVIEPGIGTVEPVGVKAVAPLRTTTYTVTATGPGGSASAQATLTVDFPPPTVTIEATPATITHGESASLHWRGLHGTSAVIEPDIGQVDASGWLTVAPIATTTYTVVVTGPGGTGSASVTVTVNPAPPQVSLTAAPMEIAFGEHAELTWSSQWAEQVVIDQGIGSVSPSGSMRVFPASATTYTIHATGPGGSARASASVVVREPIHITITSPVDGETIARPDIMVQGTFTNLTGGETGISVNGKLAMVYGDRFVVNHIPLEDGLNTITVTATDIDGHVHTADITVNAAIPRHYISLRSTVESGSAPRTMSLHLSGSFSIQDALFATTGLDPAELMELTPDEYQATFTEPGIALVTAEANHAGTTYRDTIAVVIVDQTAIDHLLQDKWADMKAHLAAGNVIQAVRHFDENKKGLYEEVFSALLDHLPRISRDMQAISMITIDDQSAKYRIRRMETHQTGTYEITYYVYFIKDEAGLWKIYRF